MLFEDFATAKMVFVLGGFILAFILGAAVNKTNFCTMGAVSDWVNMGDKGRLYAWIFAIAVAMLGVTVMEYFGLVNVSSTFPPYRGTQLLLGEYIIGGLMFGVGMTLASGCGNKNLVRIGGGNLKSVIVIVVIAVVAYFMINPFPGSDKTLMSVLFYDWIRPLSIDLGRPQDLGALLGGENPAIPRLILGLLIGISLLVLAVRSKAFKESKDNWIGGFLVGLTVFLAWWLTSAIMIGKDDEVFSLANYIAEQWDMFDELEASKPAEARVFLPQSFTFVNPTGYSLSYISEGFSNNFLTFGVMALFGVIAGSFFMSLISKTLRLEWFVNVKDFVMHMVGAVLMAFGAVLALGCTVGQAITGMSTLAVGSLITTVFIVLGSALTMKVQYYKIVYEEEASFIKALVAGMADLKLLPNSLRKLDKI